MDIWQGLMLLRLVERVLDGAGGRRSGHTAIGHRLVQPHHAKKGCVCMCLRAHGRMQAALPAGSATRRGRGRPDVLLPALIMPLLLLPPPPHALPSYLLLYRAGSVQASLDLAGVGDDAFGVLSTFESHHRHRPGTCL